jgi:hypothetical protein
MNTEWMMTYFEQKELLPALNKEQLIKSVALAEKIFEHDDADH